MLRRMCIAAVAIFSYAVCISASTLLPAGFISVDPAGSGNSTATFDIYNETGPNSNSDFPIATLAGIDNVSLKLSFLGGGSVVENDSEFTSDGSGGYSGDFVIDLSADPLIAAVLTGFFSPTSVQLVNSSSTHIYPEFSATVLPSSGNTLQMGDLAVIDATQTPEPGTCLLLAAGFGALLISRKRGQIAAALLLLGAGSGSAQVKLNTGATPATGSAGVTAESLTGSGFPSGTINPASVTVSLASQCDGAAKATVAASRVTTVLGSTRKVAFTIPAATPGGTYAVSITGKSPSFTSSNCSSLTVQPADVFVHAAHGELMFNNLPFRFGGGNTYELMYSPHATIDQVLETAVANKLTVIRTWGWIDIGELNGTGSIRGPSNGYYFQYWNGSAPAYNDSATGLANLDYEIFRAGQLGIKLIMPFTNNWTDFGGMDQYVEWRGGQYHDEFFTDATIKQWYKDYVAHLLNRVNTYTGVRYKDDPTVMIWELANEPRCSGSGPSGGGYPSSDSCSTQTITSWVEEMATYIKSIDPKHLVSVGDEGFFCDPSGTSWIDNCSGGVDTVAFAQAPGIDLMGFHLYPEGWGQTTAWSEGYIDQHISAAKNLGKPSYLGEFGLLSGNTRNTVYQDWIGRVLNEGGSGALFWDLALGQPGASSAETNNSFDVDSGAPLLTTMSNFSQMIKANTELAFPPVADNQWAVTPYNQTVLLNPVQNDVAFAGATINAGTIDLDPKTPGQQTSVAAYGGEFSVVGQEVQFKPTAGFNGSTQTPYTVEDSNGRLSNIAYVNVTVQPSAGATLLIESFETGTDGWGPTDPGNGSVAQSTTFHSDGTHSLQVSATAGGWFGVNFPSALDVSGRPSISVDVETTGMSTSAAIAFQSGSGFVWCQTANPWPTLSTNTLTTVTIPLNAAQLTCYGGTPDFTQIETLYVYLNGPGTYYLDNVRAAAPTNPNQPVEIESFETGTDGWASIHGAAYGSTSQTSAFHTDGNYGLQVISTDPGGNGDWFGTNLSNALDLSGKTSIKLDVGTLTAPTSTNVAIQVGSGYTWCQGNDWGYIGSGTDSTVTLDLTKLSCASPDLAQVHAIWVYFSVGKFYADNVRAQ